MTTNGTQNGKIHKTRNPQVKAAVYASDPDDPEAGTIELGKSASDKRFQAEVHDAVMGLLSGTAEKRADGSVVVGVASADGKFLSSANFKKGWRLSISATPLITR